MAVGAPLLKEDLLHIPTREDLGALVWEIRAAVRKVIADTHLEYRQLNQPLSLLGQGLNAQAHQCVCLGSKLCRSNVTLDPCVGSVLFAIHQERGSVESVHDLPEQVPGREKRVGVPYVLHHATRDVMHTSRLLLSEEALVTDLQKRITEAFEVFDHESNKTVDVREIGTIIRSLGCCPTEGELHDMLAEVEEEEPTGYIRFQKFLPMMTKVLLERRYRPIPEDVILRAFEVLDEKKKGYLTKDELVKYMSEEGEPFTQEEMEEMISAAVDPDKNIVTYKEYAAMMTVDDY
ncbi:dynein regulatory complex protein 8 [Rhinophrynus dorsalis]